MAWTRHAEGSLSEVADPYKLQRFADAQTEVYQQVLGELRSGAKRGHWIWFIFPQLSGLGHSPTAAFYGISGLNEAKAYLAHPVLGPRLRECSRLLAAIPGHTIEAVVGWPDCLKVRSSMTLFSAAAGPHDADFRAVLDRYYNNERDCATEELLSEG